MFNADAVLDGKLIDYKVHQSLGSFIFCFFFFFFEVVFELRS